MEERQKNPPNDYRLKLSFAFSEIPVQALNDEIRNALSEALNPLTVSYSSTGGSRNYRGLVELLQLQNNDVQRVLQSENPTSTLLTLWENYPENSVGLLLEHLNTMERFDVLDDLQPLMVNVNVMFISYITPLEQESEQSRDLAARAREFGLEYVNRAQWGSRCPLNETKLRVNPVRLIFIHHSVFYHADAEYAMKRLQAHKIIHYSHSDLPYNLTVSDDGRVFEGRGWNLSGSHTRGYNAVSLSIGFIGNYEEHEPLEAMLLSAQKLIDFGVSMGKISKNYGIYLHNDASETLSPGKYLSARVQSWPRFRSFGPLPPPDYFL